MIAKHSGEDSRVGSRVMRLLAQFALLGTSVLISLLAGELIIRLSVPWIGAHAKLLTEHDELLGWRKIPGGEGRMITSEYDVLESFNSKGLRGPEYDYEKGSLKRLLVLGDSFAEGYTVVFDESVTAVLERTLNDSHEGVFQVINAGTGGYSTDQELVFFTSEGKRYQPDVTLVMFYDNDIWYNTQHEYWRGQKPLFIFDDLGELELTNVPVPPPPPHYVAASGGVKNYLGTHSQLYLRAREVVLANHYLHDFLMAVGIMAKLDPDRLTRTRVERINAAGVAPEFEIYRKSGSEPIEYAWKMTGSLLRALKEEAAAVNSEFLVIYLPSSFVLSDEGRAAFSERYSSAFDPDIPSETLERVCRENGIDYLTLTPGFAAESARLDSGESLYFKIDGHWNAAGHRLAANLIAREIARRYLEEGERGGRRVVELAP